MGSPKTEPVKKRIEQGSKHFRQLVHAWTQQVLSEGVPLQSVVACSKAAGGEFGLSSTFLSNSKNLRKPSDLPTTRQVVALAETNRFLERLQEGLQDQPVDPLWRKIPRLTINGQAADESALMQVVSGEVRPSEIHRWSSDLSEEELDFEHGLRRYLSTLEVTIERLMTAYAPNNEARQGRMALVLMGHARIAIADREQETQAIANALTQILGREVTADQVSIGITSMA